MSQRFTLDGSEALENFLEQSCHEIAREVSRIVPSEMLQALVLCGGYGRGEGGVLRTEKGDLPYNDLEFFLFIRGLARVNEHRFGPAIHALEQKMTAKIGIDIEFKISSVETIAQGQTTMFSYDLVQGHRVFLGPEEVLQTSRHHTDARKIPLHEATRLLMNRCSGLLFAKSRLLASHFSQDDADFVLRNIRKAQLAMGDAILAMEGRYHWSCRKRHEELIHHGHLFAPKEELESHHREGVEFKLHPRKATESREELSCLHQKVVDLAWSVFAFVEMKRLRRSFTDPMMYLTSGNKCPETNPFKNALIRLRCFGWRGWKNGLAFRYPREALLHAMVVLLWRPEEVDYGFLSKQWVQTVSDWQQAIDWYQKLWNRFN